MTTGQTTSQCKEDGQEVPVSVSQDDDNLFHNRCCYVSLSVFEHTYIDTAIAPELGYNQLFRHKKSNCQVVVATAVATAISLCSKTLVFIIELPFLFCYIWLDPLCFLGGVKGSGVQPG